MIATKQMIVISSYHQKYCSQTRAHKFILNLQMIRALGRFLSEIDSCTNLPIAIFGEQGTKRHLEKTSHKGRKCYIFCRNYICVCVHSIFTGPSIVERSLHPACSPLPPLFIVKKKTSPPFCIISNILFEGY